MEERELDLSEWLCYIWELVIFENVHSSRVTHSDLRHNDENGTIVVKSVSAGNNIEESKLTLDLAQWCRRAMKTEQWHALWRHYLCGLVMRVGTIK